MQYFTSWKDKSDLKDQYKKLCKELHPDTGGDVRKFQQMQNEYLKALSEETQQPKKKIIVRKVVTKKTVVIVKREIDLREIKQTVKTVKNLFDAIKKTLR
jgi:hypothetical protein